MDHVNHLTNDDVAALAGTWSGWDPAGSGAVAEGAPGTVATCLPACDLSTRAPLAPARKLLDAGVQVALTSNCNPGTISEAIRAATFGGALALRRHTGEDRDGQRAVGSLAVGHGADLQLLNAPSAAHLAYRPGMPLIGAVWRAGVPVRR